MVTYHNEALSLVLCYNEAPSLVKISCFREHFKNIFSIGYEERRGRVYTVGQDRSVSVTKLETGTKVSIETMMMHDGHCHINHDNLRTTVCPASPGSSMQWLLTR